jgi:hypothetical protein
MALAGSKGKRKREKGKGKREKGKRTTGRNPVVRRGV